MQTTLHLKTVPEICTSLGFLRGKKGFKMSKDNLQEKKKKNLGLSTTDKRETSRKGSDAFWVLLQ